MKVIYKHTGDKLLTQGGWIIIENSAVMGENTGWTLKVFGCKNAGLVTITDVIHFY